MEWAEGSREDGPNPCINSPIRLLTVAAALTDVACTIDNRTLRGRPLAATDSGGRAASDPNDHRTFARSLGAGSGAESISL